MKNYIAFIVEGKPYGQKRPRAVRRGNFISMYSPQENVDYASKIASEYKRMAQFKEIQFFHDTPLAVKITAYFKPPKLTKKQVALDLAKDKHPTKKPDSDNISKAILDGLNKVAYNDDCYVVDLQVKKVYDNFEERVIVEIWEI
jgi:Holliday junction resolvase RusA-like endonuclease